MADATIGCRWCGAKMGQLHEPDCQLYNEQLQKLREIQKASPDRHPSSQRFVELAREMVALHDKKQKDYGTDKDPFANVRASAECGVEPWIGALIRMNDKVVRLKQFARRGSLENESARDSMIDVAVYALIMIVLYEEA